MNKKLMIKQKLNNKYILLTKAQTQSHEPINLLSSPQSYFGFETFIIQMYLRTISYLSLIIF